MRRGAGVGVWLPRPLGMQMRALQSGPWEILGGRFFAQMRLAAEIGDLMAAASPRIFGAVSVWLLHFAYAPYRAALSRVLF